MMKDPLVARYPVDSTTYDLLVVLSSKLEAMHVYERVATEDSDHRELARQLMQDDARHADLLLEALRGRLLAATPGNPMTQPGGQGGPNDPTVHHGRSGMPGAADEREPRRGPATHDRSGD